MGAVYLAEAKRDRLLARMGHVNAFVKTLKRRYSMSYNKRYTEGEERRAACNGCGCVRE